MMLEDRVALVTGAGSGIGREIAYKLAEAGAWVVVSDINEHGGQSTVRHIGSSKGEAVFVKADTSSSNDNKALVAEAVKRSRRRPLERSSTSHRSSGRLASGTRPRTWQRSTASLGSRRTPRSSTRRTRSA
jgi:NAD(P)-dependent dehydrogenase (short-subunit alcohol dehydrogenase family)